MVNFNRDPVDDNDAPLQGLTGYTPAIRRALQNAPWYVRHPQEFSQSAATATTGGTTVDSEIVSTGWICDVGGTDTWVRDVTTYLDGVAQAPMRVDSGIPCSDPQPATDYEYYTIEACVNNLIEVQVYQIVDNQPGVPFGAPIATTVSCNVEDLVVNKDYEDTRFQVLDSDGVRVPRTGVYIERGYNHAGTLISVETVLSQMSTNGTWGAYALGQGETIGEPVDSEVFDGVDIPNDTAAFVIPAPTVKTFTISAEANFQTGDFSPVIINTPSGQVTMHNPGSRMFGTNSPVGDTAPITITTGPDSNADIVWEV